MLGTTELRRDDRDVDAFLAGPKRVGLLAYLVLERPRGFQRRDKLLPLFWRNRGQKAARNALSNLLYHIRRMLGEGVIVNRGDEEVGVDTDKLWCDAVAFEEALDRGETREALDLYRGDLLEGFHVSGAAPAFSQWLDRERERLRTRAAEGAWQLADEAEQAGDHAAARTWAKKAAGFTPFSNEAQRRLIKLLDRVGDRAGALGAYEAFATRLRQEWEIGPSDELNALAEKIRAHAPPTTPLTLTAAERASDRSIAVLPFDTLGAQQATAFTEGLHGDVLTRLSGVSDLQVISRTSVRRYRNAEKTIPRIGEELGADWVLEGEVQEAARQFQMNIRLVNVREDRQVWARDYRGALTTENVFQVQGEITKKIVRALKARLTPEEEEHVEQRPTESLDAYRLHAQGRRHLDARTEEGIRRALDYFQQAIEQDASYALAWVGLADALTLLFEYVEYGHEEAERALSEAERAARRALELDAALAEAHASLGLLHEARCQGPAAVRELQRAVELKPSYAEAHNWLSWVYQLLGQPEKALGSARRAVELDPLSPEAVTNLAISYLDNGDYERALAEIRRERELGSAWGSGPFYEGLALYELGRFEEAKSVLRGVSVPWAGVGPRATLALAHVASGDPTTARAIQAEFRESSHAFAVGLIHAALGEPDDAFEAFQDIERWTYWPVLAIRHYYSNVLDPLQSDPRYEQLLREVDRSWGLAENTPAQASSARSQKARLPDLDPRAIAVLPFENLSGSEEAPPFAAGLHNDLLTSLSRVGALMVIARTSVLRYRSADASVAEVARALGVGTIVEGGVQQAEGRVRLNVQLIDVRDESLRWAETYDRVLTAQNLFDIQSELAEKITGSLRAELTPEEQKRIEQQPTENLDAYRLYAQGRRHLDARTEEGIRRALDYFRRAIEQDASYALAWAGLTDALSLFEFYGHVPPGDAPEPMEAARQAVALGPDLGETHAALGILHSIRLEGPAALQELKQAAELTPSYAETHIWLGWMHLCLGRPTEALTPARRAVQLNPLAPSFRVYLAEIHLANGADEEALREARRAREIQPEYGLAHFVEGLVLYHQRRLPEATTAFRNALPLLPPQGTPTHAEVRAALAVTHAASGDPAQAREMLAQIEETAAPFSAGLVHAALGKTDAAFDAFEQVRDWGSFSTEHVRYFFPHMLGPLRKDLRYEELIRKVDQSWGLNPEGRLPEEIRSSTEPWTSE